MPDRSRTICLSYFSPSAPLSTGATASEPSVLYPELPPLYGVPVVLNPMQAGSSPLLYVRVSLTLYVMTA